MKGILLLALPLWLLAGQQPAPQNGTVDGQVSDANTGEPVSGASLHLVPLRYQRGGTQSQPQAASGADGAFHFEAVAPGSYVITAEHAGFVSDRLNSKSQLISLSPGQSLTGIAVALAPQGTISGIVEDENGTALPGSRVEALAPFTTFGQTSLKLFSNTNANAQGKFLLTGLPANSYYLVAEPDSAKKKATSEGDLVRTVYPRSLDIDGGSTVPVTAGQAVADIAIRVRRTATYRIRGKVADAPSGVKLSVSVSPKGSVDTLVLAKKFTVSTNRTFDIGDLTPGAYTLRLTAEVGGGRNHSLLARQDIEIGGGDIEGVVLSVMPPLTVTGQVRVDSSSNAALPAVALTARPLEDLAHAQMGFARIAADGSFTLANLDPGLYLFQVHVAAPGWYVKSITLNQQDVLNKQADMSEMTTGRLDVVVSPGAGEVDVTADPGSTIVLVPDSVGPDGSGVQFGFARQNGGFSFKNVRPGKYFGYAVQRGDPNIWQNPDFLHAVESLGTGLEVGENSTQQLQLQVLPLDQVEQAAARFGFQFP